MTTVAYAALFEALTLPACVVNKHGEVLAWNAAISALTGHSAEQAIGASLDQLGKIAAAVGHKWQQTQQSDRLYVDARAYTLFCTPGPDDTWLLLLEPHAAAYAHDKHENALLQVVLHDLQNPISAISGYLDLISNLGPLSEKQGHFLNRIRLALRDMGELIGRLLEVAWLDSDTMLESHPVSLAHLAQNLVEAQQIHAQAQGVLLQTHIERVAAVTGEERRLKQVMNNLINNAIKYSPPGTEVHVRVWQAGDQVHFEVQDHGMGIPAEYHDRIFQRFFRVPDQTRDIQGNGLGLAISYEIMQKHGARLDFISEPGQGSRFFFTLPASS